MTRLITSGLLALLGLCIALMCTDLNPLLLIEPYKRFVNDVFDVIQPFFVLVMGLLLIAAGVYVIDPKEFEEKRFPPTT